MPVKIFSRMALPTTGWQGIALQTALVSLAAGLTYFSQHMTGLNFGEYTAIIMAGTTLLLTYINKVIQNNPTNVPTPSPVTPVSPSNPSDSGGTDFPL